MQVLSRQEAVCSRFEELGTRGEVRVSSWQITVCSDQMAEFSREKLVSSFKLVEGSLSK